MQGLTKLKKRSEAKINQELQALNALRDNEDLQDAITAWIIQPHLSEPQRDRLRAVLALLCRAPIKKLLAYL